jgi:hypothetical protein
MDEGTQSHLIAAIQGFGLLGFGTIAVLVLCALVCTLLDILLDIMVKAI